MKIKFFSNLFLLVIVILALIACPAKAQSPEQDATLRVYVRRDADYDGIEEGVGIIMPVYIRESGSNQEFFGFTNPESSAVNFSVFQRTYILTAYPPQTRFFFRWICERSVVVDEPFEQVQLRCIEYFFIWNPFVSSGSVTE